jgi:hypothetical protein
MAGLVPAILRRLHSSRPHAVKQLKILQEWAPGITVTPISRRLVKGAQRFFSRRQPPSECFLFFYQRQVLNRARFFAIGCERLCDRARHP